jgi:hypothetical protein
LRWAFSRNALTCLLPGRCPGDGLFSFQPRLAGPGRDTFERAADDPGSLADVPQIRRLAGRPGLDRPGGQWPQQELLNYGARHVYERAAGRDDGPGNARDAAGLHRISGAAPQDDPRDYDAPGQRLARLPRLTALLG